MGKNETSKKPPRTGRFRPVKLFFRMIKEATKPIWDNMYIIRPTSIATIIIVFGVLYIFVF